MNLIHKLVLMIMVTSLTFTIALAQEKESGTPKVSGFRADFFAQLQDVEQKIVDLAEAMPSEKYSWMPMEGVRSVSEVYMHIAGANYLFGSFIGASKPEGLESNMEKNITDKAKVVDALKKSFAHIRQAVLKTSDSDLDKPTKMFGQETTYRNTIFNAALHLHEHLGQSIAYARMNGVVPPWTAAEQAAQKKDSQK